MYVYLAEPTFVALLLHRLEYPCSIRARAIQVAWLSFAVNKVAAFIYTVVMLIQTWNTAPAPFSVFFWVMLLCIACTQMHSVRVLYQIAAKATREKLGCDTTTGEKMKQGSNAKDAGKTQSGCVAIVTYGAQVVVNTESPQNADRQNNIQRIVKRVQALPHCTV